MPVPVTRANVEAKRCSRCGETKAATEFNKRKDSATGLSSHCKRCISERQSRHYLENREQILERNRQWWREDPERTRQVRRRSVVKNREQRRLYAREYRARRPEVTKAAEKTWRENNPEAFRAYEARKQARRRSAVAASDFTAEQLAARWAYYGDKCWICRAPATATDHVKPLAKGGPHMLCNLRPICKPCNSSKSDRWPL